MRAVSPFRFLLSLSVVAAVHAANSPGGKLPVGFVTRAELAEAELDAPQKVQFGLALRNYDELCARVNRGEVVPRRELIERYCPTADSWTAVATWAKANGYEVASEEPTHLAVVGRAPIRSVQRTLAVKYARLVGTDGKEYSSTVDRPVLPDELRGNVASIYGLRNHLRPRRAQTTQVSMENGQFLRPETLRQIYAANGPGMDGEGQTIVVLQSDVVDKADLTAFWSKCGLPTTLAQFTEVDPDPNNPPGDPGIIEATMDIEAASAMAPKAKILYVTGGYGGPDNAMFLINRQATDPGLHQVTLSSALGETMYVFGEPAGSQYYALLAASGITFFASSGDSGSGGNKVAVGGYYDPTSPANVEYPASDPFVTGVGGTTLGFTWNGAYDFPATEGGWTLPDPPITVPGKLPNESFAASGGGVSVFYPRPAWQKGPGIPAGNRRCVPDVAALSISSPGFPVVYRGALVQGGGTSLSSPLWAGLCALVNQARAKAGLGPVGLLGPHIYPLIGTSAFHQMTTGSTSGGGFTTTANNGAYGMGSNYNLVTGLGSPNVREIIRALTTGAEAGTSPTIATQPSDVTATVGASASFSVSVSGANLQYQWYFNSIRSYSANVDYQHDLGEPIDGATGASYTIPAVQRGHGGWYTVMVSNGAGAIFSQHAALTVRYVPAITTQPASVSIAAGEPLLLQVAVSAVPTETYQWFHDGTAIVGATDASYSLGTTSTSSAGEYTVVVSNAVGSTTSAPATVTVLTTASKEAYLFTTLAGDARYFSEGNVDGAASIARFASPQKIAVDRSGNLYVTCSGADRHPHIPSDSIRKITPDGYVTTIAGAGPPGSADGVGVAASFNDPQGIWAANDGSLYVADMGNNTIRKIDSDGTVSTFAGVAGQFACIDGDRSTARFEGPSALVVDAGGNLIVAERYSETIRRISPDGQVVTIAGGGEVSYDQDGVGREAHFRTPCGMSIDPVGNMYVSDMQGSTIRKIAPGVIVTTLAGNATVAPGSVDGPGTAARFDLPYDAAVDGNGSVFVVDTLNSTIRKITVNGVVTTIGGVAGQTGSDDGLGSAARFFLPRGVAVDASGNLYITDSLNGTIRKGTRVATTAITAQPQSITLELGHSATLTVKAVGTPQPTYQWFHDGVAIPAATRATYEIAAAQMADGGTYTVSATNAINSLTSAAATVTVFGAPAITAPPASLTVDAGREARFAVEATGAPAPGYQWYFEGQAIAGATAADYRIAAAQLSNAGSYTVLASNQYGQVKSVGAILAVRTAGAPAIALQPRAQTMQLGASVVFAVDASGAVVGVKTSPTPQTAAVTSYQWYHDGAAIAGATDAVLWRNALSSSDAGSYACLVSNPSGTTLSSAAVLSVVNSGNPGRLINESLLTRIDGMVTIGFVIDGPAARTQRLLIRTAGPALRAFGVADAMADPSLKVIQQSTNAVWAENSGWAANGSDVMAADEAVGAFPFAAGSADAASVVTLPVSGGGYTVQVTSKSGKSGSALVELYDAESVYTPASTRLLNLSCLYRVSTQANLSTGFVVGGTTSKTLLIRAIGPALTTFGVGDVMPDPQIVSVQPLNSAQVLAANARWGGRRQVAEAAKAVSAFPLSDANAADSALLVTVPPGGYTARISSVAGFAGNVLVEVYEVP